MKDLYRRQLYDSCQLASVCLMSNFLCSQNETSLGVIPRRNFAALDVSGPVTQSRAHLSGADTAQQLGELVWSGLIGTFSLFSVLVL